MKKLHIVFSILILSAVLFSCSDAHFILDKTFRRQVEEDFKHKKEVLSKGNLFAIVDNKDISTKEKEALKFLYAYMPLGDVTDYPGSYYLENIRLSEEAKKEMPWGKDIPNKIYLHFVLPIRINNENLDDSRRVFFTELKDRVKKLSLKDAILEVNHWCHEKINYHPSDMRTSCPLASMKTGYGRCGEESTFTVAALRAVGIPARQVYTPRWAHTDDNHAWVEAWVDGKWYFLGACEPEPVLNLGWFNAPASRGMLMHTKVFGRYDGPEEIMLETPNYTEINVIDNYAKTAKITINISDTTGTAIENAKVQFKLYNYAEFYSVATKYTDKLGKTTLTAGRGDMLVWASKDGKYGYSKVSIGKDGLVKIALDKVADSAYSVPFDLVPPPEDAIIPEVLPEQRKANNIRLVHEDSVRNAYIATFRTEQQANDFAKDYKLDSAETIKFLLASRGNYATLEEFLKKHSNSQETVFALLNAVSDKDLRDISAKVLNDNLLHTIDYNKISNQINFENYSHFILNPRIANEMLTPYKGFFDSVLSKENNFVNNPNSLVEWCKKEITINNDMNSQKIPMSPAGVWKAGVADAFSRNIFFVAVARSVGLAARIDEVTSKVQYWNRGKWVDVNFDATQEVQPLKGKLIATYNQGKSSLADPKYYSHFTISKFKNGEFKLLNYSEGDVDMGGGTSWSNLLKKGTTLDEGYYMLVTGTRLASGAVLSNVTFFNIKPNETTKIDLVMREEENAVKVIGSFNSESNFKLIANNTTQSILQTTGRGYYIVAVLGVGQEPTNHALRDIASFAKDFEKWNRKLVLLFPSQEDYKKFNPKEFAGLPNTIVYGIDDNAAIQKQIMQEMKLSKPTLPIFIIGDTFNRVVFVSQGYTIGLGEQMMKVIKGL